MYVCMHTRIFNFQHKVNSDGSIIVEVTLDNVVTEVMTAAKTLKQLNVDIPDAALQMLKQVHYYIVVIHMHNKNQ